MNILFSAISLVILDSLMSSLMMFCYLAIFFLGSPRSSVSSHLYSGRILCSKYILYQVPSFLSSSWWYPPLPPLIRGYTIAVFSSGEGCRSFNVGFPPYVFTHYAVLLCLACSSSQCTHLNGMHFCSGVLFVTAHHSDPHVIAAFIVVL